MARGAAQAPPPGWLDRTFDLERHHTDGIGAGFVTYTAIKLLNGKGREVHWMLYGTSGAFVVYFALPVLQRVLG